MKGRAWTLNFYAYARPFIHRLYFIYARKASWSLCAYARKKYATLEIHLRGGGGEGSTFEPRFLAVAMVTKDSLADSDSELLKKTRARRVKTVWVPDSEEFSRNCADGKWLKGGTGFQIEQGDRDSETEWNDGGDHL